ncbi:MAG: Ig-like domain-containing protein [Longimicrobiales bacterium]
MCRVSAAVVAAASCTKDPIPSVQEPAEIQVTPANPVLQVGDTLTLTATVRDARGNVLPKPNVAWTSPDPAVVNLDSAGLIYGRIAGSASIIASAGAARAQVSIRVEARNAGWRTIVVPCGVWEDNATYCWQWLAFPGPIVAPVKVSSAPVFRLVRSGLGHRCAITTDGRAYCWGSNVYGQLGDGTIADRSTPVEVAGGLRFDSIAIGALHTCGVTSNHVAFCWGDGRMGQLGVGPAPDLCVGTPCSRAPTPVSGNHLYRAIATGGYDRIGPGSEGRGLTCALDDSGKAFCWGTNYFGSVGDGTRVQRDIPTAVSGGRTYVAIAAGTDHACGLSTDATLFCWGLAFSGRLGLTIPDSAQYVCVSADIIYRCASVPLPVASTERWRAVVAGSSHTCALNSFGAAFCWGDNDFGQVGNGVNPNPNSPDVVQLPARVVGGRTFLEVSSGLSATCGLASDGAAFCWGNGSSTPQRVPDPVR